MSTLEKFDRVAEGYSERTYADPERYARGRAELIVSLGPALEPGDEVLDLACGDAHMAEPLAAHGLRYRGADGSKGMIAAARARLGDAVPLDVAPMEEYVPPAPVAATLVLNALGYPADRVAFFRHVASYTTKKVVFDFSPRIADAAGVERDLRAAGLEPAARRAYLAPQSVRLPRVAVAAMRGVERVETLAALVLRARGQWVYAAVPARR